MLKILKSKFFIALLILAIGWLGFSLYKVWVKKMGIDAEIEALRRKSRSLEEENKQLTETIEYLRTDDFLEKEAKEKLNLQKPGEKVIIVNRESDAVMREAVKENDNGDNEPMPFWRRWFRYFLSKI